jgi:hypothetical protein
VYLSSACNGKRAAQAINEWLDHDAAHRQVIEDLKEELQKSTELYTNTINTQEQEIEQLKGRLRIAAQLGIAAVGEDGPEDAESVVGRMVARIEQHATELTCWRETAKAVGAVDDHALALHLDEHAQEIGRLKTALKDFKDAFECDFVLDDGTIVDHPEARWSPLVDLYHKSKAALQSVQASRSERSEG